MRAPQFGPTPRKPSYAIQRRSLWQRGYRHCYYCGKRLTMAPGTPLTLTLDHKIPLVLGGRNKPENYVAACQPCNGEKGAMTEADYWALRRRKSFAQPHRGADHG